MMWKKCNGISETTLHCRIDFYKNALIVMNMKRPDFDIPVYTSDEFTWKNGRGVAEASSLVGPLNRGDGTVRSVWAGARIWKDACDMGFYVISCRTGTKMLFTYVHDEDGYDGEIQVYINDKDHRITVIND